MSLWSWSSVIHAAIWITLSVSAWFFPIAIPILFAVIYLLAIAFWVPLGLVARVEQPMMTMWDETGVPAWMIIAWTALWIVVGLWILWSAVAKWRRDDRTVGYLVLHVVIASVGLISMQFVGSVSFPFRL